MSNDLKIKLEDEIFELEQITATLNFVQIASPSANAAINEQDAANSLYLLWKKQNETVKSLRKLIA